MYKLTYNISTHKESQEYISQAKEWFNYERGNETFKDSPVSTIRSIAEFIANKDGKTLYKSKTAKGEL